MKRLLTEAGPGWPAPSASVGWGVPSALLALFGAQIFAVVWFAFAAGAVYGSDGLPGIDERPIWTLLLFNAGLWLAYLLGPRLLAMRAKVDLPSDFSLRVTGRQGAEAVALGVGVQLLVLPALYWVLGPILDGDPGRSAEELVDRVDGALDVTLLAVAVVLVAPIVEEWFYRGLLLPTIGRWLGTAAGVVISSALFALVHGEVILLPGLFVFAVGLAWLTMRAAGIGPAIVAHMAFNATTLVQLLLIES